MKKRKKIVTTNKKWKKNIFHKQSRSCVAYTHAYMYITATK